MQHFGTDIVFSGPWREREEQTVSTDVPLMIGTRVSHGSRIPTSEENFVSCVC